MQKANTERCQGKNDHGAESDETSSPNLCSSCERLDDDATELPAQNASTENGLQEIYPWMKEFRSKGTKKHIVVVGDFCPKLKRYLRKWAEVKNNPFVAKPISVVIF